MTCRVCDKPAAFEVLIHIKPTIAIDIPHYTDKIPVCLAHLEDPGPLMAWTTISTGEVGVPPNIVPAFNALEIWHPGEGPSSEVIEDITEELIEVLTAAAEEAREKKG